MLASQEGRNISYSTSNSRSRLELSFSAICRFTVRVPLSRVHFVLRATSLGQGTTRTSLGKGFKRAIDGAISNMCKHGCVKSSTCARVLTVATTTYSTHVSNTVVPIVDGSNDKGRKVTTALPILSFTRSVRYSRRRLVHTLVLDRLVIVCVGRDLKHLSTLYNYIITTAKTDYNVACLVKNSGIRVSCTVGGVVNGVANVVYSKTGPDYTVGISDNISATVLSTLVTVRGGIIAPIRNVVSRGISGSVVGLASVNSGKVRTASGLMLSVVAKGSYWQWRCISQCSSIRPSVNGTPI